MKTLKNKILIINGHQPWPNSSGRLNETLVTQAQQFLENSGYQVRLTLVNKDWDTTQEVEHFVWADYIIFQFPVYWLNVPWQLKKYIDEVYSAGNHQVFMKGAQQDNCLFSGQKYLLSTTWYTSHDALLNNERLFEQTGVDGVFVWLHKANELCGMKALPSFSCHEVQETTNTPFFLERWTQHLSLHFKETH